MSTSDVPEPLDWTKPQKVGYAIPLWLRNEQVLSSLKHDWVGRLQPVLETRPEPCAIVGYGPTLQDTWEKIRDFKYIISCSGAHPFLLERGMMPTWHTAVDPLPGHTVRLIGTPHPDVQYVIASACNPDVFEHLRGFQVLLWHVFDASEDFRRILPRGEWAITGGCDVGLRSLTIAAFLGFRELHVFGLDGSARGEVRHAGAHPVPGKRYRPCVFDGVTYMTTAGMLEAARQVCHELDQMPSVRATFYGDALIQHMVRNRVPEPSVTPDIAMREPELLSSEYRSLNQRMHESNLFYGVGGDKHAARVQKLWDMGKVKSVLDYGCGKGYLAKSLPFPIWEYDPAIPGKDALPRPADLVVCTDVLEHIEPDYLGPVLEHLASLTRLVGYFVIHTGASSKSLPDGRNAHLIQQGQAWWRAELGRWFIIDRCQVNGPLLEMIVRRRKR